MRAHLMLGEADVDHRPRFRARLAAEPFSKMEMCRRGADKQGKIGYLAGFAEMEEEMTESEALYITVVY